MAIRDPQPQGEEPINLMPLIDMVFLLLIFFLVATTFTQQERELTIQLPGTRSLRPMSAPPPQMIINISDQGQIKVGGQVYNATQLEEMLQTVARDEPEREVLIRADADSPHRHFAGVANLCIRAGIRKANIGYIVKDPQIVPGT